MKVKKDKGGGRSPYPQSFREQVCRDYLSSDLSYRLIAEKYGLPSPVTVRFWVYAFQEKSDIGAIPFPPMTEKEKQDQAALLKRISELEKRLADAELRALALDTMIDVAEEELEIEIRKKPGTKQSND